MTADELERVIKLEDAMSKVCRYFETRDEMNGWIHLESPRYSPITTSARNICNELQTLIRENT